MASKIVSLCDPHLANDVEVAASSVDVTINGFAYQLDLCNEDYDTYVKPLLTLMTEHGRKVGTPAPAVDPNDPRVSRRTGLPRRAVCEICNDGKTVVIAEHSRRKHDLTSHQYWVQVGKAEPSGYVCYVCTAKPDLGSPQGLAVHGRSIHGLNYEDFPVANDKAREATADEPAKKATAARPKKR